MRPSLVISKFTAMALADEAITVHGDGSQHRNYVYVEDLAAAHVLALGDDAANQTFNLEGSEQVTVRALVESIEHALERPVQVQFGDARVGDYQGAPISAAKAADVLGWRPTVPFAEGLRRYVDWYTDEQGAEPAVAPVMPSSTTSRRDVVAALAAAVVLLPALAVTSRSGAGWAVGAASAAVAAFALLGARWRRVHLPPLVALATAVVATWLVSQAGTRIDAPAVGALLGLGVVGLVPQRRWSPPQTAALAAGALGLAAVRVLDPAALFWAAGALVVTAGAVVLWPARGAPALVHRPPRRGWAVGAVTSAAVLASWFGATSATATWFGPVTAHGSRSNPTVAVTIDGNLTTASAHAALATLASANATATFFVSAAWIEQQPDIARTIIDRGDLLATLGSNRSWAATRSRLFTDSRATFGSSVGVCPRYFRPANGMHTPLLARAARARGMRVVTWDVAPPTIGAQPVHAIVDDVVRDGKPGSIIVLRLPASGAADPDVITGTLAGVLHGLKRQGLEPVRLDDLLGTRGDVVPCH